MRAANIRFPPISDALLQLESFGELERIVDLDTKVSGSALKFRVTEQKLTSSQVARLLAEQCDFGAAQAVSNVGDWIFAASSIQPAETETARVLVRPSPIKLFELAKFGQRDVRNGGEPEAGLAPFSHREPILFEGSRARIAFGPDEDVHRVKPALVNNSRDCLAADGIQPPARQREALVCEVRNWGRKVDPAVEPRLHDVFVACLDVDQMPRL